MSLDPTRYVPTWRAETLLERLQRVYALLCQYGLLSEDQSQSLRQQITEATLIEKVGESTS